MSVKEWQQIIIISIHFIIITLLLSIANASRKISFPLLSALSDQFSFPSLVYAQGIQTKQRVNTHMHTQH